MQVPTGHFQDTYVTFFHKQPLAKRRKDAKSVFFYRNSIIESGWERDIHRLCQFSLYWVSMGIRQEMDWFTNMAPELRRPLMPLITEPVSTCYYATAGLKLKFSQVFLDFSMSRLQGKQWQRSKNSYHGISWLSSECSFCARGNLQIQSCLKGLTRWRRIYLVWRRECA